jgi:hypothetical protein
MGRFKEGSYFCLFRGIIYLLQRLDIVKRTAGLQSGLTDPNEVQMSAY